MNEAALDRKRKIVEIPLPSFSWKSLVSRQFLLFFLILVISTFSAYWYLAVRPYLWISSGHVDAVSMLIRSSEGGVLAQLAVQDGDRVEKGQVLFSLENDHILREYKRVQATSTELPKQLNFQQRQVENAMQNYLASLGVSPQDEIDLNLQTLQEEQSKVDEMQKEKANLDSQLNSLQHQLDKFAVNAPFEGVVLKQRKVIGDPIQTGDPVMSLFDLNRSWIEVRVPEKSLHLVTVGQPAKIRLAAYPHREWNGTVSWIGPATLSKIEGTPIQADMEEIAVKISFQKEDFPIKPGLSAEVGIKVH